jgi:hypothetical protein
LDFQDFDAVLADAESLAAGGYDRVGSWDLAQVCGHLAEWLRFPLDGFPRPPPPVRLLLWLLRHTVGPRILRRTLATRSMPAGWRTLRETVPLPGGNEAAAVERLRQVVGRFQAHAGPYHPSPLFGTLDRETWAEFQLIHCAHHLSFLTPRSRQGAG